MSNNSRNTVPPPAPTQGSHHNHRDASDPVLGLSASATSTRIGSSARPDVARLLEARRLKEVGHD